MVDFHPGLSKIPALVGGQGCDITGIFRQCGENRAGCRTVSAIAKDWVQDGGMG